MAEDMDLQETVRMLQERLKEMIIPSSGTPLSTYKCLRCRDSGMLETIDENGIRYYAACPCQKAREAEARLARSGLADAIAVQTFDNFETQTDTQREMKRIAEKYADAVMESDGKPRRPWLYVGGNPGSGKTHICTAVCGVLLKNNIGVRYMQWLEDARRLKALTNSEDFDDAADEFIQVPVLYIDDLFKQKWTECPHFSDADIKIAFTILNERYLLNRPTIISTEWSLVDQLMEADESVFSRVYERCKGFTLNISRKKENNFRLAR